MHADSSGKRDQFEVQLDFQKKKKKTSPPKKKKKKKKIKVQKLSWVLNAEIRHQSREGRAVHKESHDDYSGLSNRCVRACLSCKGSGEEQRK